jgi:hypothetical protein
VFFAWDYWGVVDEDEEALGLFGQEGLFLGPFEDGGEVDLVGFAEFLTCL